MFLLFWFLMWMTAATEIGPDQWVGSLITNLTGMQGILILVYTAGIMFVLRFFGGRFTHRFSPMGLMTLCSMLTACGLYSLSTATTPFEAFGAATLFGVGVAFFWPVMLGVTAELFPRGGALLLAIMGGTGQLAAAFILPIMGGWYDVAGAAAAFRYVAVLPVILTGIFAALYVYYRIRDGYRAIALKGVEAESV
jgi:MFS family permease